MIRDLKRLCTPCAGALQDAGIGCERLEKADGSTGECSGCGKRRLCFTWEIAYQEKTEGRADARR
ncbi:MAG: hypothetical protein IK095_05175 [Oscillospiraceae bacterium]|nr:hypothetical protein [Oscillospiraceae bacterium]